MAVEATQAHARKGRSSQGAGWDGRPVSCTRIRGFTSTPGTPGRRPRCTRTASTNECQNLACGAAPPPPPLVVLSPPTRNSPAEAQHRHHGHERCHPLVTPAEQGQAHKAHGAAVVGAASSKGLGWARRAPPAYGTCMPPSCVWGCGTGCGPGGLYAWTGWRRHGPEFGARIWGRTTTLSSWTMYTPAIDIPGSAWGCRRAKARVGEPPKPSGAGGRLQSAPNCAPALRASGAASAPAPARCKPPWLGGGGPPLPLPQPRHPTPGPPPHPTLAPTYAWVALLAAACALRIAAALFNVMSGSLGRPTSVQALMAGLRPAVQAVLASGHVLVLDYPTSCQRLGAKFKQPQDGSFDLLSLSWRGAAGGGRQEAYIPTDRIPDLIAGERRRGRCRFYLKTDRLLDPAAAVEMLSTTNSSRAHIMRCVRLRHDGGQPRATLNPRDLREQQQQAKQAGASWVPRVGRTSTGASKKVGCPMSFSLTVPLYTPLVTRVSWACDMHEGRGAALEAEATAAATAAASGLAQVPPAMAGAPATSSLGRASGVVVTAAGRRLVSPTDLSEALVECVQNNSCWECQRPRSLSRTSPACSHPIPIWVGMRLWRPCAWMDACATSASASTIWTTCSGSSTS